MKRNVIILLFILLVAPAHNALARTCSLEIDYSYNAPNPAGKSVRGFQLFKNGKKVCQVWKASKRSFTCKFQSPAGKFNFTLAPFYTDKSVGVHSQPYPVYIKKVATTWTTIKPPTTTTTNTTTTNTSGTTSSTSSSGTSLSASKIRTLTSVLGIVDNLLLTDRK